MLFMLHIHCTTESAGFGELSLCLFLIQATIGLPPTHPLSTPQTPFLIQTKGALHAA